MYRKLKNLLGISLIIFAVLISQLPMPQSSAETSSNASPVTVTFSMNGGTYNGKYMGYSLDGKMPVAVLDKNELISEFPLESAASYGSYKTVADTWYTDAECLNEFDKKSKIDKSITLYKKWYSITEDGFYLNPDKTVLYKYEGNKINIKIPQTVETIAANAFDKLDGVRGITLSPNIRTVQKNAFSGAAKQDSIIYVYDTGSTQSEQIGKQLDDEYGQLVHSAYLDIEEVEEIAGIDYMLPENSDKKEESSTSTIAATKTNKKITTKAAVNAKTEPESAAEETTKTTVETKENNENTTKTKSASETDKTTTATDEINEETTKEAETTKETETTKPAAQTSAIASNSQKTTEKTSTQSTSTTEKKSAQSADSTTEKKSTQSTNTTEKTSTQSTSTTEKASTQSTTGTKESESTQPTSATEKKTTQSTSTTEKKNVQSASAPRSNEHVLDSTPKTGDAVQYRMLIVICLFSIGVLLLLTGNGKKRKSAAF